MKQKEDFSIDTGEIYILIKNNQGRFSDDDLIKIVDKFPFLLAEIITGEPYTNGAEYNYVMNGDGLIIDEKSGEYIFPTSFNLICNKGTLLVYYWDGTIINRSAPGFDYFFSLKLFLTDIFKVKDFIEFHSENTFDGEAENYKEFLENIIIKYSEILSPKHEIKIKKFLEKKTNPDHTSLRKIVAIYYLLDELKKVNSKGIDKINMARFIQFLTNIDSGTKEIKDSNLYTKTKEIQKQIKKMKQEDWEFLNSHFVKLNLNDSLINKMKI